MTSAFMPLLDIPPTTDEKKVWGIFKREAYGVALGRHARISSAVYLYRGQFRQAKAYRAGGDEFIVVTAKPDKFILAQEECFEGIWPAYSQGFFSEFGAAQITMGEKVVYTRVRA